MKEPNYRNAQRSDLPELVRIYNHYVETSHVTLDVTPFSTEQRTPWFDQFAESGPKRLFVAELDECVVGYASSVPLKEKAGYASSVETSVYVDPRHLRRGIGRGLYDRLLAELDADRSVHRAYGVIGAPNSPSIALHEEFGFKLVGRLSQAGRKFDQFWDVVWYEKDLSD